MLLSGVLRSELGLWQALWGVDPWGEQRADRRAAIGHAMFANANRDAAKRPQPFSINDFMPYLERSPEELQQDVSASLFVALTAGQGARKGWDKSEISKRRRQVGKARK